MTETLNLVKQLRDDRGADPAVTGALMERAANEIERLRAELAEAQTHHDILHPNCDAELRAAGVVPPDRRETAWLIESQTIGGNTLYWVGRDHGGWLEDVNKALRFPTRKAAELRSKGLMAKDIRIAEHIWIAGSPHETEVVPLSDEALRVIWRMAGGDFHGPNVEHGYMPEAKLLPFLRRYITATESRCYCGRYALGYRAGHNASMCEPDPTEERCDSALTINGVKWRCTKPATHTEHNHQPVNAPETEEEP